jgi:CRP/FNR family transcriptional regulator, cyclic AMP receptor protein
MKQNMLSKFGRVFEAGTVLFHEGDEGAEMYIIQTGKVRITRRVGGQEMELAVLPTGEFFGEMAIVNDRPRSATATVVEEALLLVIDSHTFEAMIRGSAEIAMRMIKKIADRLEQANRQIEMLLYREPNHRMVHFLREEAQQAGRPHAAGIAVRLNERQIADKVGLHLDEVRQVLGRLELAKLITRSPDGSAVVIAEVGKLQEFLDFLEMKERFGAR